jgi:hypothetical protein
VAALSIIGISKSSSAYLAANRLRDNLGYGADSNYDSNLLEDGSVSSDR